MSAGGEEGGRGNKKGAGREGKGKREEGQDGGEGRGSEVGTGLWLRPALPVPEVQRDEGLLMQNKLSILEVV